MDKHFNTRPGKIQEIFNLNSFNTMNKAIPAYIFLILLFIGCSKKEVKDLDFKSDLYVKVNTYSEFDQLINDDDSIKLTLGGINPVETFLTDSTGSHTYKDLSVGAYSLSVSKNGYGNNTLSRFNFIGSTGTDTLSLSIMHKSTTKILDYSVTMNNDSIRFIGVISHNYSPEVTSYRPGLYAFLSDSSDVSSENYKIYYELYTSDYYGNTFNTAFLFYYYYYFPVGSTIYVAIYGHNVNSYFIYDQQLNNYYDPNLGDPSKVKSIIVPNY